MAVNEEKSPLQRLFLSWREKCDIGVFLAQNHRQCRKKGLGGKSGGKRDGGRFTDEKRLGRIHDDEIRPHFSDDR